MPERDTITVSDSTYCRFIIIEKSPDIGIITPAAPANSLWGSYTLSKTKPPKGSVPVTESSEYFVSGLILAFFILLILFSREILITIPNIIKTIFSFKNHQRLEQKLSISYQRNVTAALSALYYPVVFTLLLGEYIGYNAGISGYLIFAGIVALFLAYWIFKTIILRFLGWVTKFNQPFNLIGKMGYNHLIISVIFSFPALIVSLFFPDMKEIILVSLLSVCLLFIYLIYLTRTYQAIISYRFSHFFYILYLCIVELLPLALLTNFLLSFQ
ncbi:MAG: hypothetical protein CVU13_05455 [Bacteroidetes bacterium HGW-Bacteroidetes-8]|jgi:hypothetical protein|nr:MAG: hypothetical protein CVU13_05455 [Bacteroidetes bacterium HGW-Bacteroidetes-8]